MATSKIAARLACAVSLVALSAAFAASGCASNPVEAICSDVCSCEKCADENLKACVDNGNLSQQKAEGLKCGTQWDTYVACVQEKVDCKGAVTLGSGCAGFADKLKECTKGAVPLVAACSLSNVHLKECNVASAPMIGGAAMCTPLFLCKANCINNATCEELVDAFGGAPTMLSSTFLGCTTKCNNGG